MPQPVTSTMINICTNLLNYVDCSMRISCIDQQTLETINNWTAVARFTYQRVYQNMWGHAKNIPLTMPNIPIR